MTRSDDRVACALGSPSEEDRAKYSDAVAYHQVHETLGECDTWVCRCGNQGLASPHQTLSTRAAMKMRTSASG